MTRTPRLPPLVVETREIEPVDDLLSLTDPHNPLAWLRRGEGILPHLARIKDSLKSTRFPARA